MCLRNYQKKNKAASVPVVIYGRSNPRNRAYSRCKNKNDMKKLILLLALVFVICGCIPQTPHGVVTEVEKAKSQYYTTHYKYVVTTDNDFRFCTNETFNVGDTIQITKKSRLKED